MRLIFLLTLLSLPCYAQQDNRVSGNVTFNLLQPSQVYATTPEGAKITITIVPDPHVGDRFDAMTACSASLFAAIGLFSQFFAKYPNDSSWWVNPMKAVQVKAIDAKAQADAILALP